MSRIVLAAAVKFETLRGMGDHLMLPRAATCGNQKHPSRNDFPQTDDRQ